MSPVRLSGENLYEKLMMSPVRLSPIGLSKKTPELRKISTKIIKINTTLP